MSGKLSAIEQHPSSWTLETEVVQARLKLVVLLAQPEGGDYRHDTLHLAERGLRAAQGSP